MTIGARDNSLEHDKDALLELLLAEQESAAPPSPARIERSGAGRAPLSFAQQRLWLLYELAPESSAYNLTSVLRARGPLHLEALSEALAEIVERHEILRTTFRSDPEGPVQVIHPAMAVPLQVANLSELPPAERAAETRQRLAEEAERPFDLERGPSLRLGVFRLGGEEHILLISAHHIVYDGWSLGIFVKELAELYQARCEGRPASLPPLDLQYADYALWEGRQDFGPQIDYWTRKLAGAGNLELPTDRSPPAVRSLRGAWQQFVVPEDLAGHIRRISRRENATLFTTLLAAFQTLLYRYTGQDDFLLGVPVANRRQPEIEGLIGFFVNTLALRAELGGDPTFRELLGRTRDAVADAFEHQGAPFNQVVEALHPERTALHMPLVRAMFGLQNAPMGRLELKGLVLEPIKLETRAAKFDLVFLLYETPHGLEGELEYAADLFDADTIRRMASHFTTLLGAIAADPCRRVSTMSMLTEDERHRLLIEWNRTETAFPGDKCVHELLEAEARRRPEAIAVEFLDRPLSYRDLNAGANRLAHRLQALGVGPEHRVALLVERSLEMVIALVAVLKAGGAYVPLSPEDPDERLALLLCDVAPSVVLTQSRFAARLRSGNCPVLRLDEDGPAIAACNAETPSCAATPDNLAYVLYTSGSTGSPKGVCVSHRSVVRLVKETDYAQFDQSQVFLQLAPLAFDASTLEIWGPLLNGGILAVAPPHRLSLPDIGQCIRQHRVTTLWLTAGLFHVMVDECLEDLKPLRQLLVGGDVLSVPHVLKALRALEGCRLINGYGPTENTTFTCCYPITEPDQIRTSVPIGRPIANTRVYILDRYLRPTPIGVSGELYISGAGLARGYLGRPDLTEERFIANPFTEDPDARLYKTGDMCRYLPDSNIEFLGRRDHQVKIRGFRIELGEIETALQSHPAVRAAVVVHAGGRLAAYLVPASGAPADRAELRHYLALKLPEYMIPSDFAVLGELPLNANGKVDRERLPEIPRSGGDGAAAPRTAVEDIIAGIWAKVLGLLEIGAADNFFELGGHSLLATQVVSRLREALGIELPLRLLFQSPTVAGLAQHVEAARRQSTGAPPTIRPAERKGPMALSFAQERLWFLDQLEPGNPYYNVPIALSLKGALDVPALKSSIQAVVQRHEVLRTTFSAVDGRPVQAVAERAAVTLPVVELDGAVEKADRLIVDEARQPFDLARGPLLRIRLLRLGPDDHVLLFTMHHIVADGWSLGVLVNELVPLYRHFRETGRQGLEPPLRDLAIQYADFAAWQRDWLRGEVMDAQFAYWKRQLYDAPPVLDLPTDRPRPPAQSYRGSSVHFRIEPTLAGALRRLSRQSESTLFMTLLSAFATLLYRYSGQDDLVIGSPIANRNRGEIEPLIGFFVNTLALRVDLRGNPTFEQLLGRVRRTALDAYAHQDLPFEKLVDELQPERDLSLNPLFQVMFTLQNAPLERLELSELAVELLETQHQTALFDLVLDMWEADDALAGILGYNTDLFDEGSVRRIVRNLQTLLESIAADPARRLDDLPWLTADERLWLLQTGSGPWRSYPVERTIHELFEETAAKFPDRIAVVHKGARIGYGELNARANRIAHRLRRFGVGPNDFVAILDERGVDVLAAMLGILKAGGAFLPLDPAYPAERIRYMLADSGVRVLVSRSARLAELPEGAYSGQSLLLDGDDLAGEPASPPTPLSRATDLAYMLYTSGSTGLPKGAMIRHDGAVNHIYAELELLRFHADTAFLQSAPCSSDISVWQFLAPALIGGRTVIADYETVCDPAALLWTIRAEDVTLIELVPVVMKELLNHAGRLPAAERALPRLEWAMVTGEAATPALVSQWLETYPEVKLVNAYGPTEAADDICQGVLDQPLASDRGAVPIGRPLANLTLYVLDRNLNLVPQGVPGEICVSGIGVGAGYRGNDARTRESFVPNPYAGESYGEVIYRTGDLGRWLPDGTLECLERIDHQVKVRGFRIELGEIEGVLGGHPAIRDVVAAIRDGGDGDKQLVGYIVPETESAEVRAHLDDLGREQVELWQDLHEDSYRDELLRGDATFNVIGWDSNYTGLPLPEADMREYVDFTIERIRSLEPRRVLELGCGTGLIMFPLLPHCASYTGIDLSHVTIDRLRELQGSPELRARIPGLDKAELHCRQADDCEWLEPGAYDTVVLASVVQYFPGIGYFLEVLDGILGKALAAGGSLFVGDVRSLPLLEAFHASVQRYKAEACDSIADVAARVRQRLAQEQEMAIAPGFFLALKHRYPAITRVDILPKRGFHHNEMTRFRYDVLIRTGGEPAAASELPWSDWREGRPGVEELRWRLTEERPPLFALRRIANARVEEALDAVELLLRGGRSGPAGELKALPASSTRAGLEPEDLWQLAGECSYRADLSFAEGYPDGSFDAVFWLLSAADREPSPALAPDHAAEPWSRYANNPLHEKLARRIVPQLREYLKEKLPHYMVPSHFSLLPNLPLTPAGKVDRLALPPPDFSGRIAAYIAPRSPEEQVLASIWADILGLSRVGIHNNFFELGGHSLKATQVVSRIQRVLGAEVALRDLFNHPTIAELAPRLLAADVAAYAAIPKAPEAEHYPLSHAQRRLWVLSQLDGASAAYNMPMALLLEGPIDLAAFGEAYVRLVERHESLRTAFVVIDGAPRQKIVPAGSAVLGRLDLSRRARPDEAARELALADAAAPFDLERGAPIRASLLRLAEDRHVLLLNMHHIVSDDWSLNVLVREFVRLYSALAGGAAEILPPLSLQYRDYACWQNDYLAGAAAAHREYWHKKLAGELPRLDLATDFPRPKVKTYRGHTLGFRLEGERTAALSALAREHNASLFMALVAAVKVFLHRYTGQEDILLGFPIAGRNHPDLESQIGFYVNTLPLRDRVRDEASFRELLEQVRVTATEAYEHQAYPFDRLVDELDVARDVSRSPLFDVVVVMQNGGAPAPVIDGLAVRPFLREYEASKFDFSFGFEERDGRLQVDLTYNTDLFLPARIKRMGEHFRELVASILDDPALPVDRLRILPAGERQRILGQWAPEPVVYPRGPTLVSLFEAQAARTPDAVALVLPEVAEDESPADAGPRRTLTYGELNDRANRLARRLRRLGVGSEGLVGLCLPRSLDLVVGLLGILKAGGAYLPLDTAHPAERWAFMLDDAKAAVVLTQDSLSEKFTGSAALILCLDSDGEALARESGDNPAPTAGAENLAYVIYTSGSTGRPKGVAVTHHNVARLFAATESLFGFDRRDVWTLFHSAAFDFSVWELWGALLHGGRAVVVPHWVSRAPNAFYELLGREGVTVLNQTPSAFRQLMQAEEDAAVPRDLALRYVIFGGEALDLQSLRPWFARHGDQRPRLVNMYGITETTVHVTYRPLSLADLDAPGSLIGKALPDLRLYLLDPHREPVPIGVAGELYVGGGGVARGYLHRPDLTRARFVADPFGAEPDARLYRSGDLARFLPNGDIEYLGRIDQQVQIRGFRVELGEIEAVLAAHPDVREAVVVPEGEGGQIRLAGYFIPASGEAPEAGKLRRHLRAQLPDYMVPAALIPLDAFPLTANGKLDRAALPHPDGRGIEADAAYVAPKGELESKIAAVFREVLGTARVGLYDNFFDLGANSLLLVQVQRRLRERLGRDVPVILLFQYPTVATLAAQLSGPESGEQPVARETRDRAARRRAARDKRSSTSR